MEKTPQASKKYLEIRPEDLKKVKEAHERREATLVKVDPEWMAIAELGKHFGWQAIEAVVGKDATDNPSAELMAVLLEAGRRIDSRQTYLAHQAVFVGTVTAKSRKPVESFNKMTSELTKNTKADV